MPLLADFSLDTIQDHCKTLFSLASLAVTAYFWFVKANRERVGLRIYQTSKFEGSLEPNALGFWQGEVYLANRSTMPNAVVEVKTELFWKGQWIPGYTNLPEGHELPWNLTPLFVTQRKISGAFQLDPKTDREEVYANQRIRFTFISVEGRSFVKEIQTEELAALTAAA